MTLIFNRVLEVVYVKVHVRASFTKLSLAVYELSCVQRKNSDENNTVRRYSADTNERTQNCEKCANELGPKPTWPKIK